MNSIPKRNRRQVRRREHRQANIDPIVYFSGKALKYSKIHSITDYPRETNLRGVPTCGLVYDNALYIVSGKTADLAAFHINLQLKQLKKGGVI
jgi:hypothetical protein